MIAVSKGMLMGEAKILTTHSGSLPRPPDLIELNRARAAQGQLDEQAYAATLARSVKEVVREQEAIGIDIPDDGEFGKPTTQAVDYGAWWSYAYRRMSGFQPASEVPDVTPVRRSTLSSIELTTFAGRRDRQRFTEAYAELGSVIPGGSPMARPADTRFRRGSGIGMVCTGPIAYTGHAALQADLDNLKAAIQGTRVRDAFMCSVTPGSFIRGEDAYYKTEEEYLAAAAEALRVEYSAIVNAGFILQVDDPGMADSWDMVDPEPSVEEYRRFQSVRVDALNHALRGLPTDRVRYHVCWGSWHGPHSTDLPLKDIVQVVLRVNAGEYSLEAGNVRHEHEWEVWDTVKLPAGKRLLPGVVSHATNLIEHPDLVAQRLLRFAERVGPENVIASTDCGLGGRVPAQIAWAKLEALVKGAAVASEKLGSQRIALPV
jgi:5-methyltetrahydropteroyltriglutamate--homocysteine methyltransferase